MSTGRRTDHLRIAGLRRLAALLAGATLIALAFGASAAAADAPSAPDYGCPVGSGSQASNLRHCGGYMQASTDGTNLAWQVYLPDPSKWGPGPYPTVLDYSGYEPGTTFFDGLLGTFVNQGYAVAGLNIRGTGCSGGRFAYFEPVEWKDGYDGVEFLARQPWSNGRVAMVGKSYPGITPLYVAATDPPHLAAIVPGSFFADLYRDVAYPGGIQNTVFAAAWSLGSQPANQIDQQTGGIERGDQTCIKDQAGRPRNVPNNPFLTLNEHPFDGSIYHQRSNIYFASQIHVPVFAELAWQDEEVGSNGVDILTKLPRSTPYRAMLLNGDHGEYYGRAVLDQIFRFLSFYLKGEVPAGDPCAGHGDQSFNAALACYRAEPRITIEGDVDQAQQPGYTLHFPRWPVTQKVDRLYLHSGGLLDRTQPATAEPATTYLYTPGVGTNSYSTLKTLQSRIPADDDYWQTQPPAGTVAQFTTSPFKQDELYTGTGSLDLWLSSTAPDTDVEVMLTELRPDGQGGWSEEYLQKGWLRASHRLLDPAQSTPLRPYQTHRALDSEPLVPGTPTFMRVQVFPFSQVIRAGERLRITVEAPVAEPELWGFAALPTEAQNSIYTDPAHPSSIALPLAPLTSDQLAALPPEKSCTASGDRNLANQPCRVATGVGS